MVETQHLESIHQMRVALRRLCTAFAFFDRVLPCGEFKVFRAEAKRIASALGPARNWDAFRELVEDGPVHSFRQVRPSKRS
jgi:triphosphatase